MSIQLAKILVSRSVVPMALVESDGAIVANSPPWERLFLDALPGSDGTLRYLVGDAHGDAVDELLSDPRRAEERPVEVQLRAAAPTWVRLQATELPKNEALLVVATNVSALHAAEADLRDRVEFMEWQALSLSTLSKVMQHAHIILFSMDREGTTTMSDGRGLELIGQKPGETVGRNELEVTRGTAAHDHLTRALAGEAFQTMVEPVPGVYFDTWYMPLRDHHDQLDGVLGLAADATDRVRSERQLAEKMEVIAEQSDTIRALAAPVIKVWDGILCMPIIGAVDADRAGPMMENLLEAIKREQARFAVLDLTGVAVMDTSTVDHVLRIFAAARTIGVEGVLSGVQPAVALTIATSGIHLGGLRMMRTMHDALAWCLEKRPARRSGAAQ
jgi:rsbT co-antagonist protein RsbR